MNCSEEMKHVWEEPETINGLLFILKQSIDKVGIEGKTKLESKAAKPKTLTSVY